MFFSLTQTRLLPHIKGNVGFVFTKLDLVEVRDKLTDNRVRAPARAGALAPCPVDIEPMNTGLGPEKTSFFQALSIPTKISKGTIEIIVSKSFPILSLVFMTFMFMMLHTFVLLNRPNGWRVATIMYLKFDFHKKRFYLK